MWRYGFCSMLSIVVTNDARTIVDMFWDNQKLAIHNICSTVVQNFSKTLKF